jgi:hypothetical protein
MAVTAQSLSCTKCGGTFPEEGFDRNKMAQHRNGRHQWCKGCRSTALAARYAADPEKYRTLSRNGSMKHRFGMTAEQYDALSASQGHACAICKTPEPTGRRLCVDHDHSCCPGGVTCGKCIRGLLCNHCNRLLGMARDNPGTLLAAVNYLRS